MGGGEGEPKKLYVREKDKKRNWTKKKAKKEKKPAQAMGEK